MFKNAVFQFILTFCKVCFLLISNFMVGETGN